LTSNSNLPKEGIRQTFIFIFFNHLTIKSIPRREPYMIPPETKLQIETKNPTRRLDQQFLNNAGLIIFQADNGHDVILN
jgi:hypothetical protein